MPDLIIKKGNTRPVLSYTCTRPDASTVNLTGASVKFVMRNPTATGPAVNAAATVTSATAPATVSYTFTATDTALAGSYSGEFVVTYADTSTETFPTDGYLDVLVEEDLTTASQVGRLVTLGQAKAHLNIPSSDRSHDAELMNMLDGITPVVEFYTGPVVQRQIVGEAYDGGVSRIVLRTRPVVSVQNVVEYRGPVAYTLAQVITPDQGTIYSYTFNAPGEIVRRTVGGGTTPFPPGYNQVLVSYTAGRLVVPPNVRLGTLELLRVNYQQTQQAGRPQYGTGAAMDDWSGQEMLGFFVPNRVREMLAPSRKTPAIF